MTYNVFGGTLNLAQSQSIAYFMRRTSWSVNFIRISLTLLNRGICLILQCNGEKSQQSEILLPLVSVVVGISTLPFANSSHREVKERYQTVPLQDTRRPAVSHM